VETLLQVWGGGCYLMNKVLFSVSQNEQPHRKRTFQIWAWLIYIFGVPAWVFILVSHHNWIAASIEAGGVPAMLLGLYNTFHGFKKDNRIFTALVTLCTYAALAFGISYSWQHYGGITSLSQMLEVGVMLGFLMGSYLLAKQNTNGWLFFMLMNVSMAWLMFMQDKPILMMQQLVSLGFVIYGFISAGKGNSEPVGASE
jgi:hypothetical protein